MSGISRTAGGYVAVIAALLLVPGAARAADPAGTASLTVRVTGVGSSAGSVCVALYDDADAFPDEGRQLRLSCAKASDGGATVVFGKLPPGDYAALAFHDEDGDRRLKKNFLGMPREGVGASRGAKGFMGPPDFDDARVAVSAGTTTIRIRLKYL